MNIFSTAISDVILIQPTVYQDDRGYFFESYNTARWPDNLPSCWVQDNESRSHRGVLRGLHYQTGEHAQAKLVRALVGTIFDVAVDIRENSPDYGKWYGAMLSAENKHQLFIPRGFAHGFLVMSEYAIFAYKCDNYYHKESEGGIRYDDLDLGIEWPDPGTDIKLSVKDAEQPNFGNHRPVQIT